MKKMMGASEQVAELDPKFKKPLGLKQGHKKPTKAKS